MKRRNYLAAIAAAVTGGYLARDSINPVPIAGDTNTTDDTTEEEALLKLALESTNSPVEEGNTLNVDYSVENYGGSLNNTQDVYLEIDSTEQDRDTVTVENAVTTTGTLNWTTTEPGEYTASVWNGNESESTLVTVESAIPDSGLLHDYDITTLSLSDTDPISSIPDQSGNGNDLTQATGSNQPTYRTNVKNGNAVARIDGTDYMQATASLTQPFTTFLVMQVNTSSEVDIVYGQDNYTNAGFRVKNNTTGRPYTIQNDISGGSNDETWVIVMAEHNTSNSQIQINNSQVVSGTVADEDYSSSGLEVFAANGGANGMNGDLGRMLAYDRSLSSSEITDVFNSLNAEWAVY